MKDWLCQGKVVSLNEELNGSFNTFHWYLQMKGLKTVISESTVGIVLHFLILILIRLKIYLNNYNKPVGPDDINGRILKEGYNSITYGLIFNRWVIPYQFNQKKSFFHPLRF